MQIKKLGFLVLRTHATSEKITDVILILSAVNVSAMNVWQ